MLTEEQQSMLWAAVEKMEESNQRTYALFDELRASAQRLAATALALVSAYQDGSGKPAATTPTPSSSSSSTTAEEISGVAPITTNSMSTTTSLGALVPSPTSDPTHDAAPATSIATTGTPAGDAHQVFDAGPISGHLHSGICGHVLGLSPTASLVATQASPTSASPRDVVLAVFTDSSQNAAASHTKCSEPGVNMGICVLAPVMFKEVVSLEVLNKLNMPVTTKSSTPSSARYFSYIPTAAVPMLEMCMSDVAKQRPAPWPSFNYCQAQVQLIAASIDGILTIACQMMNSASRIWFHTGQPSNYLQSVEPLSQMVLDGCIRKRRDFILLDSSWFRKEQTSKMPKPPWLLCAEVFCSWFGRMQLIGGLLLEASPWYREYLLFVQRKTPGPPTVWFCSTEARTTKGAVRRLVHSFLKLISENSALYAWESSDVVQVPLLDPLELLQLEYEVALLIDQLFKRIISCTTEGVQLISATKPSVVLTHGSNTAIILHSWRYYAASEVGVQLVIIQDLDDNKVFGMGIIQNWVTCVIEKLQVTWDPGDSTTIVNNAASMEKVSVKEQSTSWVFLQNGNNILGVYTSSHCMRARQSWSKVCSGRCLYRCGIFAEFSGSEDTYWAAHVINYVKALEQTQIQSSACRFFKYQYDQSLVINLAYMVRIQDSEQPRSAYEEFALSRLAFLNWCMIQSVPAQYVWWCLIVLTTLLVREVYVLWDPGGCCLRLGDKPKFKEGEMLATYTLIGPFNGPLASGLGMGQRKSPNQARRHREQKGQRHLEKRGVIRGRNRRRPGVLGGGSTPGVIVFLAAIL